MDLSKRLQVLFVLRPGLSWANTLEENQEADSTPSTDKEPMNVLVSISWQCQFWRRLCVHPEIAGTRRATNKRIGTEWTIAQSPAPPQDYSTDQKMFQELGESTLPNRQQQEKCLILLKVQEKRARSSSELDIGRNTNWQCSLPGDVPALKEFGVLGCSARSKSPKTERWNSLLYRLEAVWDRQREVRCDVLQTNPQLTC